MEFNRNLPPYAPVVVDYLSNGVWDDDCWFGAGVYAFKLLLDMFGYSIVAIDVEGAFCAAEGDRLPARALVAAASAETLCTALQQRLSFHGFKTKAKTLTCGSPSIGQQYRKSLRMVIGLRQPCRCIYHFCCREADVTNCERRSESVRCTQPRGRAPSCTGVTRKPLTQWRNGVRCACDCTTLVQAAAG